MKSWQAVIGIVAVSLRTEGGLLAAEAAILPGDDIVVLADDDAVGIGIDLDRPPECPRCHRVLVVIEPHQERLGDEAVTAWKLGTTCTPKHNLSQVYSGTLERTVSGRLNRHA